VHVRVRQETINEHLDGIEDILSPGAPLQLAFAQSTWSPSALAATAAPTALAGAPAPACCSTAPTQMITSLRAPAGPGPLAMALEAPVQVLSGSAPASHTASKAQLDVAPAIAAPSLSTIAGNRVAVALQLQSPSSTDCTSTMKPDPCFMGSYDGAPGAILSHPDGETASDGSPRVGAVLAGGAPSTKRQRRDSVGTQLLDTLSLELGLTSTQVDALSDQKGLIHSDREIKGKCLQLIRELRSRVAEQISTSQSITDGMRRILTPVQVAKFLMWVEKNQRSMDLLNTMLHSDGA